MGVWRLVWCAGGGLERAGIPHWSTAAALLYPLVLVAAAADGSPPPCPPRSFIRGQGATARRVRATRGSRRHLTGTAARRRREAGRRDPRKPPPRGRASVPADTGNRGMASEAGGTHARASGGRPLPRRASPAQLTRPPQTHFLHFSDGEWRWGARVGVAVRCSRMLRWAMTAAAGGHAAGAAGVAVADGRASVEPTRLVTDGRREGVGKGGEILP